tara:strand:- start:1572 stop:2069 length:498 start_codon:yes stop_codon:yes gene_type:complete
MIEEYQGSERRKLDKADEIHRSVTERHGRDISGLHSEVAGLKIGLDNVDKGIGRISKQIDQISKPKESNWTAVGSLIIAIVLVFGAVFGFLFNAQAKSTEDALASVQRESDLRHRIRTLHEKNLTESVMRLQDQVIRKLQRQEELNLHFITGNRFSLDDDYGETE